MAKFISIEGGEGVGKSTFIEGLMRQLGSLPSLRTHEPGGTPLATEIRRLFVNPPEAPYATTELCLVSAARAQHVEAVIKPALKAGKWVICDRFADSTRVYQGILGGIPRKDIEALINFSTGGLEPDLTFVLDCPIEISMARLSRRRDSSRFDQKAAGFHNGVREAYRHLSEQFTDRMVILDASRSLDDLWQQAATHLQKWLSA